MDTAQVPRTSRARARAIFSRLEEIDRASVRPARAIALGIGSQRDMDVLQELEMEAVGLREELRALAA